MKKTTIKKYGPALIVFAAFLWGVDGLLRQSLYTLPPTVIVFYEHLIGAIIIAPATIIALKKEKVDKADLKALFWISLLSGLVGTLMFTAALVKVNYISISIVFLLQKLQPIFAVSAAVVLLKEKIDWRYGAWAILAFVAAFFVTFKNGYINLATGSGTAIAALLAIGAAFAWGSSTAISRLALSKLSSTLTTGLRFFITVPLAFLAVILFHNTNSLSVLNTNETLKLITIALSTGMVALWIYYKGLKTTQVKVATFLELAFPLTAVFLDVVINHTVLGVTQYLAGVVLLFAMYRLSLLNNPNEI